jgi:hypothetical protein
MHKVQQKATTRILCPPAKQAAQEAQACSPDQASVKKAHSAAKVQSPVPQAAKKRTCCQK